MRIGFRLRVLVSAVVLALTGSIAAGAAVGVQATGATPTAPHTLYVSVANRYLTMPHRVAAGQYYLQVRTSDSRSVVQVVRPPAGYTTRQYLAAATLWRTRYASGADPRAAYTAFVRSVTSVGGAVVTRGGVGSFATGLTAGTYWLYEDTYDVPTHLARISVLTVVGTPPAQTHATAAGVVRFSTTTGGLTLPASLPTSGWLLGIGGAPLNSLAVRKLVPGVTKADLDTRGVCFPGGIAPPTKDCFVQGFALDLGGKVSAGASVFWYYRLAPGDYVTGNIAPNAYFDRSFLDGWYARFTVS
jgi:hypothetical protein